MKTYMINDVREGKVSVAISSSNGSFEAIRKIAREHLKKTDDCVLLRDLVKVVREQLKIADVRKANNYTRNALKKSYKLQNIDGIVFVIR